MEVALTLSFELHKTANPPLPPLVSAVFRFLSCGLRDLISIKNSPVWKAQILLLPKEDRRGRAHLSQLKVVSRMISSYGKHFIFHNNHIVWKAGQVHPWQNVVVFCLPKNGKFCLAKDDCSCWFRMSWKCCNNLRICQKKEVAGAYLCHD